MAVARKQPGLQPPAPNHIGRFFFSVAVAFVAVAFSLPPQPAATQAPVFLAKLGRAIERMGQTPMLTGRNEGYPACTGRAYVREDRCRVGALSHFDTLFPCAHNCGFQVAEPVLARAPSEPSIRYTFTGQTGPSTSILIASQ